MSVNLFDIGAALVLLVSTAIGVSRGVVKELVALFAFTAAALLAVYLLPFTAPLARHSVHPAWAANATAIVAAFLIAYIALRVLGSGLSAAMRRHSTLGLVDRGFGLAFGVARGLLVLGVVYLVFKATPAGYAPDWMRDARLFPLSAVSGRAVASLAPQGLKAMGGVGRSLKANVSGLGAGAMTEDTTAVPDAMNADPGPPPPPVEALPPDAPPAPPVAPPTRRTLQVRSGDADAPAPSLSSRRARHRRRHPQPQAQPQD